MQKRFYSRIIILAAIAAIGVAGFVIAQRTSSQSRKPATGRVSPGTTGTRSSRSRRNSPAQTPIRPADPNRAPQAAIDEALYTNEEFFGTSASVARPFATALGLLETLLTQYPKDAQLRLHAARLAERLDPVEFQRLHRNGVARKSAIVALSRSGRGELMVELSNGMKLPVSRSHRKILRKTLRNAADDE